MNRNQFQADKERRIDFLECEIRDLKKVIKGLLEEIEILEQHIREIELETLEESKHAELEQQYKDEDYDDPKAH